MSFSATVENEIRVNKRQPRAIVFTHFGSVRFTEDLVTSQNARNEFTEIYQRIISKYLQCNTKSQVVPIVYIYVDWGIKNAPLEEWAGKTPQPVLNLPFNLLRQEQILIQLLEEAEREARNESGLSAQQAPRFHYIGVSRLISLLNELVSIDPHLVDHLSGPEHQFTYDSPKFIEAVIRIARGFTARLAWDPVIRFDEDVEPNPESIHTLLETYSRSSREASFYFFSGTYGDPDSTVADPINDHAVRTHWLCDLDQENKLIPNNQVIRHFLADLSELGASQIVTASGLYTRALTNLLNSGVNPRASAKTRISSQVISGAGLIMSLRAIDLLPPFMNFGDNTLWVDDHLKRRLHEALKDLGARDTECVAKAKFKQDRHPNGITAKDIDWAKAPYFDRLLRGCIFRRLISNLDDTPTDYSSLIGDIVRYRVTKQTLWYRKTKTQLTTEMKDQAIQRYDEVLKCWSSAEFIGYASHEWAEQQRNNPQHRKAICKKVVDDALGYINLVLDWPVILRAIKRLPIVGHDWLFDYRD